MSTTTTPRPMLVDVTRALLALGVLVALVLPLALAAKHHHQHAHAPVPVAHVQPVPLVQPVGTVVDMPGGLQVLTRDGWATCLDGVDGTECGDAQVRKLLA